MTSPRCHASIPLCAVFCVAAFAGGAARAEPITPAKILPGPPPPIRIDFLTGTYANVSASPTAPVDSPLGGTSTFYLRKPGGFNPADVIDISVIGVTLLPVTDVTVTSFPVNLFLPPSSSVHNLTITTLGPPTLMTTFQFVAPQALDVTSGSGGTTFLEIVSGLGLATSTDPVFEDFLKGGGFTANLTGVTFIANPATSGGSTPDDLVTPMVSFNSSDGSTGAAFTLSLEGIPGQAFVPEPNSLLTWAVGGAAGALCLWRRRRRGLVPAGGA